jgi:plastocyanin
VSTPHNHRRLPRNSRYALVWLICGMLISLNAQSKQLLIKVLDQNNTPVPNAVISFPSLKTTTTETNIAVMDQVDKQFSPRVLIVDKNQKVAFPNSDEIRHHVYSFSNPNQFEIKLFSGEEAQPMSFSHSGIVVLGCNIHDNMIGYIYVSDDKVTVLSNKDGLATIDLPDSFGANTLQATAWHAQLSISQNTRTSVTIMFENDANIQEMVLPFDYVNINKLDIEGDEKKSESSTFKKKFGR